jgi:hypothetical protein
MMKPDTQENLMRRYLLGDLPELETNELEVEVLRDDEKFDQMWEVENQLVDGYVRGILSSADRERFERHYQSSPIHRQRVAVAKNLVAEADRSLASVIPTSSKMSWASRLSETLGFSLLSWQSALVAATLLLAICSLWLFVDRSHLRQSQEQLTAESQSRQSREGSLTEQLATAQDENKRLESEIERLRAAQNVNSQSPNQPERVQPPSTFSLLLSPMLVRGGGAPQTLIPPPRTDLIRLQMKVDRENARRLQVRVRTVEGRQVWEQQIKAPASHAATSTISAEIPASKLPLGDYILTLSAITSTDGPQEINRYFFRVIRH